MPIYEYQCQTCGHRLEKLQKISAAPLTDCPACGRPHLRKLVSAVAFRLKGGGWYETDFKDEQSRRNIAKDDDNAATKADGAKTDEAKADGTKRADAAGDTTKKPDSHKKASVKPDTTGSGATPAAPAG